MVKKADNKSKSQQRYNPHSRQAAKRGSRPKKSFWSRFFTDPGKTNSKPKKYRKKQRVETGADAIAVKKHRNVFAGLIAAVREKLLSIKKKSRAVKKQEPADARRHSKNAFERLFAAVMKKLRSISATGAAASKTGRAGKLRKLIVYSAAGALVIAVVLVLVLVPDGHAKDIADDTADNIAAAVMQEEEPTPTPIKTTLPEMTRPETTPTADTGGPPVPSPTPIVTTTPMPSPTPTPEPKPTPTPEPSYDINEIVEDYRVVADKYYNEMGFSNNYYEYTQEEYEMLARVIYAEAGSEPMEGKIAVGNVVMNRVLNLTKFDNTISEVILSPNQFAYHPESTPNQNSYIAASQVLDDQKWLVAQNVYFFKNSGGDWGSKTFYIQIYHHYFYSYDYSGRNNNDLIPDALFERVYEWPRYGCKPASRVRNVQSMLHSLGYDVSADGYFGIGTKEAVEKFQSDHGLASDGVAGPSTIKKLISTYGFDKYIDDFID